MKILITGVNGFLGEEIAKFFLSKKKFLVFGSDISSKKNSKFSFINCDLTKSFEILENEIQKIKPDIIVHCAAKIFEETNKKKIWELNYYSTKKLYELSKKCKVKKFIFISTFSIFEKNYNYFVNENEKPSCINEYGKSKVASENYIRKNVKNIKYYILRCPIIMSKNRGYRISILSDLIKDNFNIPIIGNGKNKISFVHSKDISQAIYLILKKNIKSGVFNICSDDKLSFYELISDVIKKSKSKSKIVKINRFLGNFAFDIAVKLKLLPCTPYHKKIFNFSIILDNSKLKKITGWKPKFSSTQMFYENLKSKKKSHENSFSKGKAKEGIIYIIKYLFLIF